MQTRRTSVLALGRCTHCGGDDCRECRCQRKADAARESLRYYTAVMLRGLALQRFGSQPLARAVGVQS